nr:hypothetical protein [uncultured Allomuricauda sp.]
MNNKNLIQQGKDTRFPNNDPRKGGRKPSLRKDLERLLDNDGKLTIASKNVVSIEPDGSVVVNLPKRETLMAKLLQIANGKTSNSLKAIEMIITHLEGKPKQPVEFMQYENKPTIFIDATGHLEEDADV